MLTRSEYRSSYSSNNSVMTNRTDTIIQNVIRSHFSACTVLIIAHHLNTVMDCEKIMVYNCGIIIKLLHCAGNG